MPITKQKGLQKRPTLAETVERNPLTGAPVAPRKGFANKKVPPKTPAYFKKFVPEVDEEGRVIPRIRRDITPLGPSESDKTNPFLQKDEPAPEPAQKGGLRLVKGGQDEGARDEGARDAPEEKAEAPRGTRTEGLPQPKVLMEDDQTHFNNMMGRVSPAENGGEPTAEKVEGKRRVTLPDVSDDPEILAAEEAAKKALHDLEKLKARKKMMVMVANGETPDPDKVEELCAQEPWKQGDLTDLSVSLFGFVPNKFEFMAESFEEGSADRARYTEAYEKACKIYDDQIKRIVRGVFNKLAAKNATPVALRAQAEGINARINAFRKGASLEGDLVMSYQSGMLMRAMLLLGHYVMNNNGGHSWGRGVTEDGRKYESFKLTTGKDGPDIKPL